MGMSKKTKTSNNTKNTDDCKELLYWKNWRQRSTVARAAHIKGVRYNNTNDEWLENKTIIIIYLLIHFFVE